MTPGELAERIEMLRNASGLPVGATEIAKLFGVRRGTVHQWVQRGVFCHPKWRVGGILTYDLANVVAWGAETGRIPAELVGYWPTSFTS